MNWLNALDVAGFRWVNQSWANPLFDAIMPWLSGNPFFAPTLVLALVLLVSLGGVRGRVCGGLLILALVVGNVVVFEGLKEFFGRARPFVDLADARVLVGRGGSPSMPSSHAANWFLGTAILLIYYPRTLWVMLPLAVGVSFSRVYCGVHYPSDVLAGAAVGAGLGFGGVGLLEWVWRSLGRRWFPLWWRHLPSWRKPVWHADALAWQPDAPVIRDAAAVADRQWLRLGYGFVLVMLLVRWAYVASDTIQLSEDEAYQWLWSKHLALSYYSKPPMIAYLQWVGTTLWGDTELGVRFFSPLCAAVISLLLLRFFAAQVNARAGFALVLALTATPLMAVGSVLMTIDPPLVLFWVAAMVAGWKAVQPHGRTRDWAWVGLWMALGFLSKYLALAQWVSFALVFALWPPARRQLGKPGPYVALAVSLLGTVPVLVWNAQHDWITVTHVSENAQLDRTWAPTLRFVWDFLGAMLGLLNPVFFLGLGWAGFHVWRRRRLHPLGLYLLLMGAPVFLGYAAFTLYGRVLPNWIAVSVVPLFAVLILYGEARWRTNERRWLKPAWVAGLTLGLTAVTLLHESNWIAKLTGQPLPARLDPLRRVRDWDQVARVVGEERRKLAEEGRPVFVIGDHSGVTGLVSFYLPEAKQAVQAGAPFVFVRSADHPENQFFFWPGYAERRGQNAIYVIDTDRPVPAPERLVREFESVTDLGVRDITSRGRVMKRLQLFACRGLR
ncbi:MAG: glycosyltransferase family 39 protein [Verrucomicrobiales bacterium]|nr:glycosyltransferase family 39 protein [Verrucomicrobiales bacterium]